MNCLKKYPNGGRRQCLRPQMEGTQYCWTHENENLRTERDEAYAKGRKDMADAVSKEIDTMSTRGPPDGPWSVDIRVDIKDLKSRIHKLETTA